MWIKNIVALVVVIYLTACTQAEPVYNKLSSDGVILAFGDSLTYGTGASPKNSYPTILSQLTGHTVVNAGIPGEISEHGLRRLPGLLDEHQPELLILTHGANDILRKLPLDKARENLEAMVQLAQQRNIKVVMLAVPSFNVLVLNSAPFYSQVAEGHNVPIDLDTLADIIGDRSLKADRVHPNDAGYRVMAENVFKLLQSSGAL